MNNYEPVQRGRELVGHNYAEGLVWHIPDTTANQIGDKTRANTVTSRKKRLD